MARRAKEFRLPTVADLPQLKKQVEKLVREEVERRDQRLALQAMISHLEKKDGPTVGVPLGTPHNKGRIENESWTGVLNAALEKSGGSLSYDELKEAVRNSHLKERLARSDKGFYGGIMKLERRGTAKRHNGRIYLVAAYHALMKEVASGRAVEFPAKPGRRSSPQMAAVWAYLKDGKGATPGEILEHLKSIPELAAQAAGSPNSTYNMLNRESKRGELVKRSGRYYLPGNEPPVEAGGSEGGGANIPSIKSLFN